MRRCAIMKILTVSTFLHSSFCDDHQSVFWAPFDIKSGRVIKDGDRIATPFVAPIVDDNVPWSVPLFVVEPLKKLPNRVTFWAGMTDVNWGYGDEDECDIRRFGDIGLSCLEREKEPNCKLNAEKNEVTKILPVKSNSALSQS